MRTLIAAAILALVGCGGNESLQEEAAFSVSCNGRVDEESMTFAYSANADSGTIRANAVIQFWPDGTPAWGDARYVPSDNGYELAPVSFASGWAIAVDRTAMVASVTHVRSWTLVCQ